MKYLVTTNLEILKAANSNAIAMVDGTVPGWVKGYYDLHFDHHAPGGGKVQIDEMPSPGSVSVLQRETNLNEQDGNFQFYKGSKCEWAIVTTQVDADACVAAAWLQLTESELTPENTRKLRAIALDCDYLCIRPGEPEQDLAEFGSKAVAALKESTKNLPTEMGLPIDRKSWSEDQKVAFASECFRLGTEWLIAAVRGERPFPGESGEADAYFESMQKDIEALRWLRAIRLIKGCAVFDQRSIGRYVDPRCLVTIARELEATEVITLSMRSMPVNLGSEESKILIPGYSYTLGSLPYHEKAGELDLTKVFPVLAEAEKERRGAIGQPPGATSWGGRAAVGGSGFRDGSLLSPEEVLNIALIARPRFKAMMSPHSIGLSI